MPLENLSLALSSSLTSVVNLYPTILALGLMQRLGSASLPEGLAGVADTWVLVLLMFSQAIARKGSASH